MTAHRPSPRWTLALTSVACFAGFRPALAVAAGMSLLWAMSAPAVARRRPATEAGTAVAA